LRGIVFYKSLKHRRGIKIPARLYNLMMSCIICVSVMLFIGRVLKALCPDPKPSIPVCPSTAAAMRLFYFDFEQRSP